MFQNMFQILIFGKEPIPSCGSVHFSGYGAMSVRYPGARGNERVYPKREETGFTAAEPLKEV